MRAYPTVGVGFLTCLLRGSLPVFPPRFDGVFLPPPLVFDLFAGGVEKEFAVIVAGGFGTISTVGFLAGTDATTTAVDFAGAVDGGIAGEGAWFARGGLPTTTVTSLMSGFDEADGDVSICTHSCRYIGAEESFLETDFFSASLSERSVSIGFTGLAAVTRAVDTTGPLVVGSKGFASALSFDFASAVCALNN